MARTMIYRLASCVREAAAQVSQHSLMACLLQWTTLLCNLVALRWIPPAEMGVWGAFLLWEAVLLVVRLGFVNAMAREYPYLLGKGKTGHAARLVQVTAFHTLVSGIILMVVALGLTASFGKRNPSWLLAGLCFCVYSPATLYQSFLEATFRGGRQFARLARIQWAAIVLAVISLVLVLQHGFPGYCLRQAGLAVVLAAMLHWRRPVKARPCWDRALFLELFKTGLPLFFSNYLTRLIHTIGHGTAFYLGGQHLLGLYTPVSATITCFANLPNVCSAYFQPKQNFEYGRTGDASRVVRRALVAGLGLILMALPLSLMVLGGIPWVVGNFLPFYQESTTAMQMATLAGALRCFSITTTCYSTLKAWRPMFLNLGLMLGTQGGGVALGLICLPQRPLEAIVLGLMLGQIVYIPATMSLLKTLRQPVSLQKAEPRLEVISS